MCIRDSRGFEILNRKGATCYGIAAAATGILKAVLQDENRILPVSTLLEGEYGENNVFCGVPAILNRTGVADVLELGLTAEEPVSYTHLDVYKRQSWRAATT